MSGNVGSNIGGMKAAKAWVELVVDDSKLTRGLARCELEMRAFANKLTNIGSQMFGMGAAMLAPIGYAVRQFAELDDTLRLVRAVTRASSKEFEQLSDKARLIGKTTSFTSQQVAEAMANLGRAGFDPKQIDGMIKHVMNLARATQTNVSTAAEITGNAMRQFGLQAKDTQRIVDVMTAAANNSSQTLEDIAVSFKYAAPVAKEFGMAIEEVAYYVGVLANQGLKGEMAGTSLRNILARLGGADVQEQFANLGIDLRDRASGKVKTLRTLLAEANAEMNRRGWDALTRQEWLHKTFGLRSMSGGAKLTSAGDQYIKLFEAIMNSAGEAERTAKQMDEGIGGAIRITISALQELGNVIAESVTEELKALGKWIQQTVNHLITFFKFNKQIVVQYVKLGASLAIVGAKFFMLGAVLRVIASIWNGMNFTIAATIAINKKLVTAFSSTVIAVRGMTRAFMLSQGASAVFARSAAVVAGTLTAWLPVIGAVTLALGGLFYLFKRNRDLRLETGAQEKADELKRGFAEDEQQLKRLSEIQKMQEKSNGDLEEAANIISDLQKKYGNLGLSINRATREVDGLVDEQKKLNELQSEQNRRAYAANNAALNEIEDNIDKTEEKLKRKFNKLGVKQDWSVFGVTENGSWNYFKPLFKIFKEGFDATKVLDKYGEGFFERDDWFDVMEKEGAFPLPAYPGKTRFVPDIWHHRKDLLKKMSERGEHPITITDANGKRMVVPIKNEGDWKDLAGSMQDLYFDLKDMRQRQFDLRGEQRLRASGGFVSLDDSGLATVSQEYPDRSYLSPINIKSVSDVLREAYGHPYTGMNADNFREYRWNVTNALTQVQDERITNGNILSQIQDKMSNEHPDLYAKGAGFADTDNTRYGLFGQLGYLGENRLGESRVGSIDDFKQYVQNLRASLISKADEGGEAEKVMRRLMLTRLDEFEQAYLKALVDGTAVDFDFSKWSDLASYEATTLIKDRIKELTDQYKKTQNDILNDYIDAVDEAGNNGYKIYSDEKDENGNRLFVKDETGKDRVFPEKERQSYLNAKANEATESLGEMISLLARIGDVVTAQERFSESMSSEETLRRTQNRTHEDLLEIMRKMDRDYELARYQIESKYGLGNEYEASRNKLLNDRQADLAVVDKRAEEKLESGADPEEVERWRKRERAEIEKDYRELEKANDWEHGIFRGPAPQEEAPGLYEDMKGDAREEWYNKYRRNEDGSAKNLTPEDIRREREDLKIANRMAATNEAGAARFNRLAGAKYAAYTDEERGPENAPLSRKDIAKAKRDRRKEYRRLNRELDEAEKAYDEAQKAKEETLKEDQEYFSKVADRPFRIEGADEAIGDYVENPSFKDEIEKQYEEERKKTGMPLLNMRRGDVLSALKDGLLDKGAFSSGLMQKQSGDFAIEDIVTYRGQTYNLAPDGVYRPFGEPLKDRALAYDTHRNNITERAEAVEEIVKPEKPSVIQPAEQAEPTKPVKIDIQEIAEIQEDDSVQAAQEAAESDKAPSEKEGEQAFPWERLLEEANLPEELGKMAKTYFGENIAKRIEWNPSAGNVSDYRKLLDDFLRIYKEADESDEYGLYAQEYLETLMSRTPVVSPNEPKVVNGVERKEARFDDNNLPVDEDYSVRHVGLPDRKLREEIGTSISGINLGINADNVNTAHGIRVRYWPGAAGKVRKEILRRARMENNDRKYRTKTTGWDEANALIQQEIQQKEYEKGIASRVGNDNMVKSLDADIKSLERDKVANDYGRAVSNIDRLEKRRKIDARQYEADSRKLRVAEKKLARAEREGNQDKIKEAEDEVRALKDKRKQSLENAWLSNKDYTDAALMIKAYETAGIRPMWDVNRSFASHGTFDAYETQGQGLSTVTSEMKEQTTILSNIEDYVADMANGEYL